MTGHLSLNFQGIGGQLFRYFARSRHLRFKKLQVDDYLMTERPRKPTELDGLRRMVPIGIIAVFTFAVCLCSSIFTSSYGGVIEEIGVSQHVVFPYPLYVRFGIWNGPHALSASY